MNLYLLTQDEAKGYDTCSSIIVVANNEREARRIHPCETERLSVWTGYDDENNEAPWNSRIWAKSPENVKVQLLGVANPDIKNRSVIQYCFHAG